MVLLGWELRVLGLFVIIQECQDIDLSYVFVGNSPPNATLTSMYDLICNVMSMY